MYPSTRYAKTMTIKHLSEGTFSIKTASKSIFVQDRSNINDAESVIVIDETERGPDYMFNRTRRTVKGGYWCERYNPDRTTDTNYAVIDDFGDLVMLYPWKHSN